MSKRKLLLFGSVAYQTLIGFGKPAVIAAKSMPDGTDRRSPIYSIPDIESIFDH